MHISVFYVFTCTQPRLSTAKGYNTTTNLQVDHFAAHWLPELWSHVYMPEASSESFKLPLIPLLAPRVHILGTSQIFQLDKKMYLKEMLLPFFYNWNEQTIHKKIHKNTWVKHECGIILNKKGYSKNAAWGAATKNHCEHLKWLNRLIEV